MHTGIIVKGFGSYYYVMDETGAVYECRVRGISAKSGLCRPSETVCVLKLRRMKKI